MNIPGSLKSFRDSGPGAPISRMRNMWDSIETHCWPVDRMAAKVLNFGPWLPSEGALTAVEEEGTPLLIDDVVDVTRPPPPRCDDLRGKRSKYHVIVGFAHRKHEFKRRKLVNTRTPPVDRLRLHGVRTTKSDKISTWYVLRADGCIVLCNSRRIEKKLQNLDSIFAGELSVEETEDFYRWMDKPPNV